MKSDCSAELSIPSITAIWPWRGRRKSVFSWAASISFRPIFRRTGTAADGVYFHRYAMVALATMNEKTFVPSLLEAPGDAPVTASTSKKGHAQAGANYSIDTVRD